MNGGRWCVPVLVVEAVRVGGDMNKVQGKGTVAQIFENKQGH